MIMGTTQIEFKCLWCCVLVQCDASHYLSGILLWRDDCCFRSPMIAYVISSISTIIDTLRSHRSILVAITSITFIFDALTPKLIKINQFNPLDTPTVSTHNVCFECLFFGFFFSFVFCYVSFFPF